MTNRIYWFAIIFIFSNSIASSQTPYWRKIVPEAFAEMGIEIRDSIRHFRTISDTMRAKMIRIIEANQIDRISIAGAKDEYINEGMHKKFVRAPAPFQINMKRDEDIVQLENLHIDLYYADMELFKWLDFQKRLNQHPNKELQDRWTQLWNELPTKQRPVYAPELKKFIENQLACDLLSEIQPIDAKNAFTNMERFDPKMWYKDNDLVKNIGNESNFPFPVDFITASYPMNGQFAFDLSESIPHTGYIEFGNGTRSKLYELYGKNYQFRARWTSSKNDVSYTLAQQRFHLDLMAFFFDLPDTLLPGYVYKLELIALPEGYLHTSTPNPDCWNEFRGKFNESAKLNKGPFQGELKITELYFRTSKYNYKQKLETMHGTLNWEQGAIEFETDEPLDPIEMNGNRSIRPPVTFTIQQFIFTDVFRALNSNQLYYYFTTPKVEELAQVSLAENITAELDHTLDAPFIRKTSLGNPIESDNFMEEREQATILYGNYIAPRFKNYDLKDSLVTSTPIPFITQEHFLSWKPAIFERVKCTLFIGDWQQILSSTKLHQEQIHRRMEERAEYFYELDNRKARIQGKPFTSTLDDYKKQELDNMPNEAKLILEAKIPDTFNKKFTVLVGKQFPGSEQFCYQLEIKFY
ncbi:MAG: hypothetical protein WBP41_18985 [Saprospiraceae bacterium]